MPPTPGAYQEDDYLGFRNILPPGQNGFASQGDNFQFLISGNRPPHSNDQLDRYANLVYAGPTLTEPDVDNFFKDASFGVQNADVEETYTPDCAVISAPSANSAHCDDVTIQRDNFGVPHIYGADRAAAIFAAGYTGAEDRLAFMDVERNAGRARLSSFLGGGSAAGDRSIWRSAPYTEADLQQQYDDADELYGIEGAQLQTDVDNYVDGINQYIAEARAGPAISQPGSKIPGFYGLIDDPSGPAEWKVTDVVATASLVAGIFGKGGGREVTSALIREEAIEKFGATAGPEVWVDFREQNDDDHTTTIHDTEFPYGEPPASPEGQALPDPGTTVTEPVQTRASGAEPSPKASGPFDRFTKLEDTSNALLISDNESATGKPLAVMGPQVGYFTPQILTEMDIHAPASAEGPALDARGVGFTGINMYVLLGRGQDYAWSATSAGQDIIDTYAVKLCEPGPDPVTIDSDHYEYDGSCEPFEVLERTNSWTPSAADSTPAGSETLRSLRTKLGIVTHRAMVGGEPVAYTQLRATYGHEADGARGFADFNSPDAIDSASDYRQAAAKIDYTFNWFYADNSQISYFNSGANPLRPLNVDESLPVEGDPQYTWVNFDPADVTFDREPDAAHPQVTDQDYIANWNNKQAPRYSAADDSFSYGSVHRAESLSDRIEAGIAGSETMTRAELVAAMEDAGSVDIRGSEVFPVVEQVLRSGRGLRGQPRKVKKAVSLLSDWADSGAHRRDLNHDGVYEDTAAARLMDAWWPRLVGKQFRKSLGDQLYTQIQSMMGLHNRPGAGGSAYGSGWYGYVEKDLRSVLGEPVTDPFSREYCGKGKLRDCREGLLKSLKGAVENKSDADIGYPATPCAVDNDEVQGSPQWCYDAIRHTAIGAITQPPIHTINRPTFQQVVAPEGHRP